MGIILDSRVSKKSINVDGVRHDVSCPLREITERPTATPSIQLLTTIALSVVLFFATINPWNSKFVTFCVEIKVHHQSVTQEIVWTELKCTVSSGEAPLFREVASIGVSIF